VGMMMLFVRDQEDTTRICLIKSRKLTQKEQKEKLEKE
jgi:hypothetical protein